MRNKEFELPPYLQSLMDSHDVLFISDLAKRADIKEHTLYHNLRGKQAISLKNAIKVANAFDLDGSAAYNLLLDLHADYEKKKIV